MILLVKIQNFLNRAFADYIVAVEPPREWWIDYRDVGMRLEGYKVPVTYKYAGRKERTFSIDNEHLRLITPEMAIDDAQKFYEKTMKKIELRKQQENENTK